MIEYAVYKGEQILCIGTADECAKELKVKPEYIQWLTTPTAKRRWPRESIPKDVLLQTNYNRQKSVLFLHKLQNLMMESWNILRRKNIWTVKLWST
ncbi:hypothetical protein P4571_06525 [Niallia alba]|uniref:hypothetical protein n=1 Tax=Niallia alba TaxID=2729105 RepID=UPI002E1DC515|nr:hypothetical protein [Niallia alba]